MHFLCIYLIFSSCLTLQRHKRLKKIFVVLHEELKVILPKIFHIWVTSIFFLCEVFFLYFLDKKKKKFLKKLFCIYSFILQNLKQRIKDFAVSYAKDWREILCTLVYKEGEVSYSRTWKLSGEWSRKITRMEVLLQRWRKSFLFMTLKMKEAHQNAKIATKRTPAG